MLRKTFKCLFIFALGCLSACVGSNRGGNIPNSSAAKPADAEGFFGVVGTYYHKGTNEILIIEVYKSGKAKKHSFKGTQLKLVGTLLPGEFSLSANQDLITIPNQPQIFEKQPIPLDSLSMSKLPNANVEALCKPAPFQMGNKIGGSNLLEIRIIKTATGFQFVGIDSEGEEAILGGENSFAVMQDFDSETLYSKDIGSLAIKRAQPIASDAAYLLSQIHFPNSSELNDVSGFYCHPNREALGVLDPSLSNGGVFGLGSSGSKNNISAIDLTSDGKILIASAYLNETDDFAIFKLQANGTLDSDFGTGGRAYVDFGGTQDTPGAIINLPDGKILVFGTAATDSTLSQFAAARLLNTGALDTSFGTNGKLLLNFGSALDVGMGMGVQSDGKILFVGRTTPSGGAAQAVLIRISADGILDGGFGTGGRVLYTGSGTAATLYRVALQPDGKILGAANVQSGTSLTSAALRFLADGTLDSGFGEGGTTLVTFGRTKSQAGRISVLPDGKIIIAGTSYNGSNYFVGGADFSIARLNASGSLDSTFGEGTGYTTIDFGLAECVRAMVIQSNGKIVLAGESLSGTTLTSPSSLVLARLNADGALDSGFGQSGKAQFSLSGYDFPASAALQSTGEILVGGRSLLNSVSSLSLVRLK